MISECCVGSGAGRTSVRIMYPSRHRHAASESSRRRHTLLVLVCTPVNAELRLGKLTMSYVVFPRPLDVPASGRIELSLERPSFILVPGFESVPLASLDVQGMVRRSMSAAHLVIWRFPGMQGLSWQLGRMRMDAAVG